MNEPLPNPPEAEEALEALVAEVTDEFLERAERGERPDPEEYRRRYPQIAEVLRNVLPALEVMRASGPSGPLPQAAPEVGPPLGCLGDFRLLREVGRGGMGIVYEAEQISLHRRVALKVLPFAAALDPKRLERFRHEAQAAALLHHSHIVPVYAVGCERGVYYYAMQFIEGQSLAEVIAQLRRRRTPADNSAVARSAGGSQDLSALLSGPLPSSLSGRWSQGTARPAAAPPSTAGVDTNRQLSSTTLYAAEGQAFVGLAVHWAIQAAEALEHAHSLGIVHRDIKPANLLIDLHEHLWVTDFGLAQHCHEAGLTATGDLVGTLRYMSPEQALGERGRIDHRTDIYALAATLYELLTLQPLLDGRNREELLRQVIAETPAALRRLNRAVAADLETILLKALAKEPAERYASAGEMAADLRHFLAHEPIRAKRPTPLERASKWVKRHRGVALSAVAMLLVTVVALAISTVLVLREQAKTLEEQAKTQRELQQARQMLDFFTRMGEEDLAEDTPARTKLLQAALDYYEQFLERSEDDPIARSELTTSRGRVEEVLRQQDSAADDADELEQICQAQEEQVRKHPEVFELRLPLVTLYWRLGVFQGQRLLDLAGRKPVRSHLKLSAEQASAIQQLATSQTALRTMLLDRRDPAEVRHDLEESGRAIQAALAKILSPAQRTRLEQLVLQSGGLRAFSQASVVAALELSRDQSAAIQQLRAQADKERREHRGDREGDVPAATYQKQVLAILTPDQDAQWQTMIGEKVPGIERLGRWSGVWLDGPHPRLEEQTPQGPGRE